MMYDEWQAGIPDEIKGDSLWKLEVYRLGLFIGDIAWQDALALSKTLLTRDLANQLYMLSVLTPHQRQKGIREEQATYTISPQPIDFKINSDVPFP